MKLLLTGGTGFVAPHVVKALRARLDCELMVTAQSAASHPDLGAITAMNLADAGAIASVFDSFRPTHVLHLGALSTIGAVAADIDAAWHVNLLGTLHCARALQKATPEGRFVYVGTGQVYGETMPGNRPFLETDLPAPTSEYAATKAAAEVALGAFVARGLRVLRLRPFNHTGPGQGVGFAVPRFAAQIAAIEAGRRAPVMSVGNLAAQRDFLDVRDVADAYARAIERMDTLENGLLMNVASGEGRAIGALLDELIGLSRVGIRVEQDPALLRSNDAPVLVGDPSRARALLDWTPRIPIAQTIADVLDDYRAREKAAVV